MLPFRRLRGAVTRRGAGSAAASTGAHSGDDNTLPPATALQQPRQRRLQCQLLLHLAWLAMLLSTTAASLVARKERHLQLARELLAASGGSSDGVAGGVAGSGAGAVGSDADDLQQCAEALQLPQVALLFLVKGPMHHEALWRLWFQSAAGLLPTDAVAVALCSGDSRTRQRVLHACGSSGGELAAAVQAGVGGTQQQLQQQQQQQQGAASTSENPAADSPRRRQLKQGQRHGSGSGSAASSDTEVPSAAALRSQALFDVYVHPHPSFPGYPPGSLFHGRELPQEERVATEWGQHSLVDAARSLLRTARRNPRVRKFVLLSESDLPLFSPHLLYEQLVHEPLSRINACNTTRGWNLYSQRWVDRMATGRLQRHHWRKSWQWFALTPEHVDLVLADTEVDASLRAHCRTMFEPEQGVERECYSDEHHFPTVLALAGRDNETDCQGWVTDTDWLNVEFHSPHPHEYTPGELSDALLPHLRRIHLPGCGHAAEAAATAAGAFVPAADLKADLAGTAGTAGATGPAALAGTCQWLQRHQAQHRERHVVLGPRCRMLARKFKEDTVTAALAALAPCDSAALVLNNGMCPGETPRQAGRRRLWQRAAPLLLLGAGSLLLVPLLAALLLGAAAPVAAGSRRGH